MAELVKYPVPQYDAGQPYHVSFDNVPLKALADRDVAINGEVENIAANVRDAQGTQGTLANRLNQSINQDGSIKSVAIDNAMHNIADHADGSRTLTDEEIDVIEALGYPVVNPVGFVRMIDREREKLAGVAEGATSFFLVIESVSEAVTFDDGPVTIEDSDTVTWQPLSDNRIKAHMAFPAAAAHRHYYDVEPITDDYESFSTTTVNTPFVEDTLRVYVNGSRLSATASVYVPGPTPSDGWTTNSFTADPDAGTFTLANAVTEDDVVRIDFDTSLV